MFGTDYPFVPTQVFEVVASKVRNELINDKELSPYAEDFIRKNAIKLFKIEE